MTHTPGTNGIGPLPYVDHSHLSPILDETTPAMQQTHDTQHANAATNSNLDPAIRRGLGSIAKLVREHMLRPGAKLRPHLSCNLYSTAEWAVSSNRAIEPSIQQLILRTEWRTRLGAIRNHHDSLKLRFLNYVRDPWWPTPGLRYDPEMMAALQYVNMMGQYAIPPPTAALSPTRDRDRSPLVRLIDTWGLLADYEAVTQLEAANITGADIDTIKSACVSRRPLWERFFVIKMRPIHDSSCDHLAIETLPGSKCISVSPATREPEITDGELRTDPWFLAPAAGGSDQISNPEQQHSRLVAPSTRDDAQMWLEPITDIVRKHMRHPLAKLRPYLRCDIMATARWAASDDHKYNPSIQELILHMVWKTLDLVVRHWKWTIAPETPKDFLRVVENKGKGLPQNLSTIIKALYRLNDLEVSPIPYQTAHTYDSPTGQPGARPTLVIDAWRLLPNYTAPSRTTAAHIVGRAAANFTFVDHQLYKGRFHLQLAAMSLDADAEDLHPPTCGSPPTRSMDARTSPQESSNLAHSRPLQSIGYSHIDSDSSSALPEPSFDPPIPVSTNKKQSV
jgi:hypothetical protein